MTTREAARPLRRYMRARVRAASLAPTYTITRDVTHSKSADAERGSAMDKHAAGEPLGLSLGGAQWGQQ